MTTTMADDLYVAIDRAAHRARKTIAREVKRANGPASLRLQGVAEEVRSMNTRRAKVLIVDCDEDVLITFERLLEDEGYDTTTAWTGQDAREAVQGRTFDLVLVNEYLPDMKLEDFISELRRRGHNVPGIVMQLSASRINYRLLAAGAIALVCKWSQAKAIEAVCEHVSSTAMRPQRHEASALRDIEQ